MSGKEWANCSRLEVLQTERRAAKRKHRTRASVTYSWESGWSGWSKDVNAHAHSHGQWWAVLRHGKLFRAAED